MSYYENSCKFYYDRLIEIGEEPKMAKKLELGIEIPEFFFFYLVKIGIKSIPNTTKKNNDEGSFFELVKFITSLEGSGVDKDNRIAEFKRENPSWYSHELLRIIAEQKAAVGIGKKKIEEILKDFVPLRRPSLDEEYDPDVDYEDEDVDEKNKNLGPLEEAERYKTYILRAEKSESKTRPIEYPAMVQKKYDGTRRLVFCTEKNVFYKTRQGKNGIVPPQIEEAVRILYEINGKKPFVLDGEFYVPGVDRAKSNGIANKKDVSDQTSLIMAVWDYFFLEDYVDQKTLSEILYRKRYNLLVKLISDETIDDIWYPRLEKKYGEFPLEIAEWWKVNSKEEALAIAKKLAQEGEEGGVLKDFRLTFKDGPSHYCLKLKQVFDCNLVITGINPGEGKFKGMVGSFIAESSDGELKVSVSGMDNEVRSRKSLGKEADKYWIGKIINVTFLQFNEKNTNGIHTLHSPQFSRINDDVTEADSIDDIYNISKGILV